MPRLGICHTRMSNLFFIFPIIIVCLSPLKVESHKEKKLPKNLVMDTDLDIEDVLAILYILKQNISLINLKAITLDSNAWVNPGFGVNMLYDLLYVMGRDDIPIGVGGEGGITKDGTIQSNVGGYLPIIDQELSTAGSCRYRQAIPPGRGAGSLDIDTHYGLRRKFLPQGERHYIPGKQNAAQRVLLQALSSGSNTVLLTGSHTNFALLLMSHPQVKKNIEHVYIMGGGETGNLFTGLEANPKAEFNIFADPFASYQVFFSGLPITLVPLEATNTVPITENFIDVLEKNLSSFEANYTYQIVSKFKRIWPQHFSQYFYLWDSFAAAVALSGMMNEHNRAKNQFGVIRPANMTIVTSNKPYGVEDGSNPLFLNSDRWRKFKLQNLGPHSGHIQTGLRDQFCYVPHGQGTCMDGCTMKIQGEGGTMIDLVTTAKQQTVEAEQLDKLFYSHFIEALNSPHQTGMLKVTKSGFPDMKASEQNHSFSTGTSSGSTGRPVVFDMDMSPGDFLALIYLLRIPRTIIELKAVTVAANGLANAAAIDMVYDVLHMMGRDDIPVGLGAFFALGQAYSPGNATGDCKYRKAVPQGATGLIDSDTLYGVGRFLPQSPRSYVGGEVVPGTKTADEELLNAVNKLQSGSRLTILTGGTLTNIAMFLTKYPTLKHLVEEVFVLGGSLRLPGNVLTVKENMNAELNFFLDPRAAEIVMSSKLKIRLVPLDVTDRVNSPKLFLKRLKSRQQHHGTARREYHFVHRLMHTIQHLKHRIPSYKHAANPLSEVVAAVLLVNATSVRASRRAAHIIVESTGNISTDGWTKVLKDVTGSSVEYYYKIDNKALDFEVANAITSRI